jgi:hypothetical protein
VVFYRDSELSLLENQFSHILMHHFRVDTNPNPTPAATSVLPPPPSIAHALLAPCELHHHYIKSYPYIQTSTTKVLHSCLPKNEKKNHRLKASGALARLMAGPAVASPTPTVATQPAKSQHKYTLNHGRS